MTYTSIQRPILPEGEVPCLLLEINHTKIDIHRGDSNVWFSLLLVRDHSASGVWIRNRELSEENRQGGRGDPSL